MTERDLQRWIEEMEADGTLLEAGALRRRIEALDALDGPGAEGMDERAGAMRARIEAANAKVYASIREGIRRGEREALRRWIEVEGSAAPGLDYDFRDEAASGVLALREPEGAHAPEPEMVFYQPTPVRHVMAMIEASGLSEGDVLVDLGSGLGHVALLAGMLTGARCVGVEVEPAYVARARECAERLGLSRVTFAEEDARSADLSRGTVFFLYTPFTGTMLAGVLERLRRESVGRAIRVCTLGPCAETVAREAWLTARGPVDAERVTVFENRE